MRKTTFVLAMVAAAALGAQSAPINGGLQVGLSLPTGDFADKKASDGTFLGANEVRAFISAATSISTYPATISSGLSPTPTALRARSSTIQAGCSAPPARTPSA